ncbi:arsenite efflux transporter metallochaperone ArsD [Erysipelothrix sp. HDW6B]|uniref:arsenite efflux transporter metallochaperone ArsD n=1 Tax=Erysipelothrix sp. HDW6B TaxID=2714929 RepID=UPI00196AB81C|nr:arsenite efflux transporter metallochaperone ArsD [Erysipelothrix sp. HDW6B]
MKIEIYEPAMCCSTGVCGANVDKELLRISTIVDKLQGKGIDIERFNLSSTPSAFVNNAEVARLLVGGKQILPITLINGKVVKTAGYPTDLEINELIGE